MNKKVILAIVAVITVLAIILLAIYLPSLKESSLSGSFTKADKYREGNVENKDLILRSEFLKDTNKLKQSINQLLEFGTFAIQLKTLINEWWVPVLSKYSNSTNLNEIMIALKDYEKFIDNNTSIIQSTIATLAELYADRKSVTDTDVESDIKQFYTYVEQFIKRDSIFELSISKIDNSIKNEKFRKDEIKSLRELRDRIVVDNYVYALSIGDTSKMAYSLKQELSNPGIIKNIYSSSNYINAVNIARESFIKGVGDLSNIQVGIIVGNNQVNTMVDNMIVKIVAGNRTVLNELIPNSVFCNRTIENAFGSNFGTLNKIPTEANVVQNQVYDNVMGFYINNTVSGFELNKDNLNFIVKNQEQFNSFIIKNILGIFDPTFGNIPDIISLPRW